MSIGKQEAAGVKQEELEGTDLNEHVDADEELEDAGDDEGEKDVEEKQHDEKEFPDQQADLESQDESKENPQQDFDVDNGSNKDAEYFSQSPEPDESTNVTREDHDAVTGAEISEGGESEVETEPQNPSMVSDSEEQNLSSPSQQTSPLSAPSSSLNDLGSSTVEFQGFYFSISLLFHSLEDSGPISFQPSSSPVVSNGIRLLLISF